MKILKLKKNSDIGYTTNGGINHYVKTVRDWYFEDKKWEPNTSGMFTSAYETAIPTCANSDSRFDIFIIIRNNTGLYIPGFYCHWKDVETYEE